jgi:tetratricopeptide (TPR) repeat protein
VTPKDDPYAAAQLELAAQLEAEGEPREAAATLRRLLGVAAAEAGAAESLAFLEARQGRLAAARGALERARRVRGVAADDPGHRYSLTLLYEEAGRWAAAARLAAAQLAEDPDDAQVLNLLGYGLAERGLALERAVALLERSRALDPLNPYVLDSLGWARYRQGQPAQAIPWLEQAVQVDRRLCEGWNHLGEALQAAGRWTAARRAWRSALACGLPASTRALVRGRLRALDAPGAPPEPWAPRARTRRDP